MTPTRRAVLRNGLRLAWIHLIASVRDTVARADSVVPFLPPREDPQGSLSDRVHRRGIYLYEWGRAGETRTITFTPEALFRGDRLEATDTSRRPGKGTKITGAFVGAMNMMPYAPSTAMGILTEFFHKDAVGNIIELDACRPGISISLQIHFLADCEWIAELWGDALVD